ncbi:kinase-like domain-containing protein [Obelidium mucronatum]|nr:kinase-like domain-containing protein [Obelidium mucronatum]
MITTMEYLLSKYDFAETLGTGAFSEVKVAIEKATGNRYAIKIIDKARCRGKEGMIDTEINILLRVRHENIVQLYEMFAIENKIYLVMEIVTGGELFDEIVKRGKYTEQDASKTVHKILGAVEYLHSIDVAHRDLKPENLLLSEKSTSAKVMISDFGLSKILNDETAMKTACGTPGYVAPEVLRKRGYGKEVDLWSIGIMSRESMEISDRPWWIIFRYGMLPVDDLPGQIDWSLSLTHNLNTAKDFIRKLLVLDPRARLTARQALAHPFVVKTCGATLYGASSGLSGTAVSRGVAPQASGNLSSSPASSAPVTSRFTSAPTSSIPIPEIASHSSSSC